MTEPWINFLIVVFVEFTLFIIIAIYCQKKLAEISHILVLGVLTGLVVGIASDLLWGKSFGFWSYRLGYDAVTLVLNGALIWGLFSASILLMNELKPLRFSVWLMVIMMIYEVANNFLNVWTYEIMFSQFGLFVFVLVGNFFMAIFIAAVGQIFFGRRFLFVEGLLKKF